MSGGNSAAAMASALKVSIPGMRDHIPFVIHLLGEGTKKPPKRATRTHILKSEYVKLWQVFRQGPQHLAC